MEIVFTVGHAVITQFSNFGTICGIHTGSTQYLYKRLVATSFNVLHVCI